MSFPVWTIVLIVYGQLLYYFSYNRLYVPFLLHVYTESPNIQQSPESVIVDEKESRMRSVVFECTASGTPSLQLSWFNDGYTHSLCY